MAIVEFSRGFSLGLGLPQLGMPAYVQYPREALPFMRSGWVRDGGRGKRGKRREGKQWAVCKMKKKYFN